MFGFKQAQFAGIPWFQPRECQWGLLRVFRLALAGRIVGDTTGVGKEDSIMTFDPRQHPRQPDGRFRDKPGMGAPHADASGTPRRRLKQAPLLRDVRFHEDTDTGELWFTDMRGKELDYCTQCHEFHYLDDMDWMEDEERAGHSLACSRASAHAPEPMPDGTDAAERIGWAHEWTEYEAKALGGCGLVYDHGMVRPMEETEATPAVHAGMEWYRMPDGSSIPRGWARDILLARMPDRRRAFMRTLDSKQEHEMAEKTRSMFTEYWGGKPDGLETGVKTFPDSSTAFTIREARHGSVASVMPSYDPDREGWAAVYPGGGRWEDADPNSVKWVYVGGGVSWGSADGVDFVESVTPRLRSMVSRSGR